jgi:hypothetical protein
MEAKKDFKKISQEIKDEILRLGYGTIKIINPLWNDVDSINIDFDVISLFKGGAKILTYDDIHSIDRQIQIYETIYEHQDQLSYYQLDWSDYFKALAVKDEHGRFIWRILTPDEARHLWYNGKGGDLCELFDDGTEGMIDDEERLNRCIEDGCDIGISVYHL